MRMLLILLLFFLSGPALLGQNDFRVIGLINKITASVSTDYYIQSVEDQRAFRANLGIVNRGPKKDLKRPLIPESDFFEVVQKRMNAWIRPGEGAEPVVAKLRELYIWENQWMNAELGFVRLEMAFSKSVDEETVIIVEFSGKGQTVGEGHAPRLEKAFFLCLQRYTEKRQTPGALVAAPKATFEPGGGRARLMAVDNFLRLWEGNLIPVTGNLRRRGGLYRYRLKQKDKEEDMPYYALLKDERLFIWAANYPGAGNYYTRVLEQGRYMFMIDELFLKRGSGLKPEVGNIDGKTGIIIDMKTGVPQIVDDELMEQLMAPYPELQEKYLFKDILNNPFQLTRVQYVIAEINRREREH